MISNILIRYNIHIYIYICVCDCVCVCRYYTCGHVAGFCGEVCPRIRSSSTLRRGATGGMGWNIPNGCLRNNLHRKPCFLEYVYIYIYVGFLYIFPSIVWNNVKHVGIWKHQPQKKQGSTGQSSPERWSIWGGSFDPAMVALGRGVAIRICIYPLVMTNIAMENDHL